jgi:hypothetical protein
MITEEQLKEAREGEKKAQEIIRQYFIERNEVFKKRLAENPIFTDEELRYSAVSLCPCGHGLAYPKDCNINHYWDCSAILKGIADKNVQHTAKLPFSFYNIKSENEQRGTTRGIFKPK